MQRVAITSAKAGFSVVYGRFLVRLMSFILCGGLGCALAPAGARAQTPPPAQADGNQQIGAEYSPSYNGQDFTRPLNSLTTRLEYRSSAGAASATDRELLFLQLNSRIDLGPQWRIGILAQLPVEDKTTTIFVPPSSSSTAGIGGSVLQVALIHSIDRNWAFGFGGRFVAPGLPESIGSGKWQAMPGLGIRYSFLDIGPDTYFVPVVRFATSFAGDPARRNIREPQIAPTLNIGLPERWFITFYPSNDIRINYGPPISGQTGRLFLPLNLMVGRKFTDSVTASFEFGVPLVADYPVYRLKAELRLVWQF